MVTYAGAHWLTLVDNYGASGYALLFVVFFEVVGLSWGVGAERVKNGLYEMIGRYPNPAFPILWKYISPAITLVITQGISFIPFSDIVLLLCRHVRTHQDLHRQ